MSLALHTESCPKNADETHPAAVLTLPLTAAQPGIWFASQIEPEAQAFVVAHYADMEGVLDVELLRRAIRIGLTEADTIHARFSESAGMPVQSWAQERSVEDIAEPDFFDLTAEADPIVAAHAIMRADLDRTPLPGADDSLYRHIILKVGDNRWFWHQRYHHLCVDGYSFAALTRRIVQIYSALAEGQTPEATPLTPFAAVVDEYRNYSTSETCERDRSFWGGYLEETDVATTLAVSDSLVSQSTANLDVFRIRFQLDAPTLARLIEPGQQYRVVLPEMIMAGVFAYQQRMTGTNIVIAGVPFMRRMGSVAINATGPVVNVLPVKLVFEDTICFGELAQRLSAELRRVRKHQRYDAEQVQRDLGLVGSGRSLYGPTVNFKVYDGGLALPHIQSTTYVLAAGPVEDIEFGLWYEGDALTVELSANPARYSADELMLHRDRLSAFLRKLIDQVNKPIGAIRLPSTDETDLIRKWAQGPRVQFPPQVTTILDIFERNAILNAGETAIVDCETSLDFRTLSSAVVRLGRFLIARGIGPGDIVATALPRRAEAIVAMLGVMASGAAWMPLDPDYPADRLSLMCTDAKPALLLTRKNLAAGIATETEILCLDDPAIEKKIAAQPSQSIEDADRIRPLKGDDLAYIIYTSGSTGTPKGVMVPHQGLLNLLLSHETGLFGDIMRKLGGRRVRAGHAMSLAFDTSWEQIIWMLLGHELHLCDEEERRDAHALIDLVVQRQIDTLDVSPSMLQQIINAGLLDHKHRPAMIQVGGEAVPAALWRELRRYPDIHFHNFYGPTEYSVDTLHACVNDAETPVIGRPVANTIVHILDNQLRTVPIGVAGELYISGVGLARGYLGRAGLTASRFVADPFDEGALMYRTGDLARWRLDGQVDYIGRSDHQIKLRGFRVEPGEIEHTISALPGVTAALVLAEQFETGLRLLAWFTGGADEGDVMAALRQSLPDYMVPSSVQKLDAWPLNVNGKIERKELPRPYQQAVSVEVANYADDDEKLICECIAEVIGLGAVRADQDFFALGGDSISAMALCTKLRKSGHILRPRDVFGLRRADRMKTALQQLQTSLQIETVELRTAIVNQVEHPLGLDEVELKCLRERHGSSMVVLPALPLQEGLLFHTQLDNSARRYNSLTRIDLTGPLDTAALRSALDMVLQLNPQLTARFESDLSCGVCQILPMTKESWPVDEIDLSHIPSAQQADALRQIQTAELDREVSPSDELLVHANVVHLGENRHAVLLNVHHLIIDGWSTPLLLRDLLTTYADGPAGFLSKASTYPRVVRELAAREKAPAENAWSDYLLGVKPTLLFDTSPDEDKWSEAELNIPQPLEAALWACCRENGLTLNTLMQGAWGAVLSLLTGRSDVLFGSPVSGRFSSIDGIQDQIGLFNNTIPVRFRLDARKTLLDQLVAFQSIQGTMLEYDCLTLATIQRIGGVGTLFDTLLVSEQSTQNDELRNRDYAGVRLQTTINKGFNHYPVTMKIVPGEKLCILLEYNGKLKQPEQLLARVRMVLDHLAYDNKTPWSQFAPLVPAERELIDAANATLMNVPDATLRDLLNIQASRSPDAIALSDENHSLTYAALRHQVMHLAKRMQVEGVGPGTIVAVALPRSVLLTIAIHAVIEAGAAYLPLDTGYPDERLGMMINDAQPALIITAENLVHRFNHLGKTMRFDEVASSNITGGDEALNPLNPNDPAYLIYTSGSTGRPKGVLVSHRAIVNRLAWMQHEYRIGSTDVVLQKTPASFDVSVWEFFWPLMEGATLYMAPPEAHRDPDELARIVQSKNVTVMHFVPSMLATFLEWCEEDNIRRAPMASCLRLVFCSGEALPRGLAERHQALFHAELHNLYGPTEAAVDVTYKPARGSSTALVNIPIGRPVWNTQLRILDRALRPVPVGVPGDLYLCGIQLADYYLDRAALTATRFVSDPFADGERMYRTGDVARWLANGDVDYLGRSDDQLKIRGQRIELGEIEAVLKAQPAIVNAAVNPCVLGVAGSVGDARQLVGYVVTDRPELDISELKSALAVLLPAHMVPTLIVQIDALPLSLNGKLDRKALPIPAVVTQPGRQPRPGLESQIAAEFAAILQLPSVQADDDFFSLGGHSLLAMRLASKLRANLGISVSVGQVMMAPSVAKLAALIAVPVAKENPAFGEVLELRGGNGNPLFCFHSGSGFAWQYSGFLRYLPGHLGIIGIQSPRPNGVLATSANLDEACDRLVEVILRLQPAGPYHFAGYSIGGTLAQGVAVRLQNRGEEIGFLGLFDAYPPEEHNWDESNSDEMQIEIDQERERFLRETSGEASDAALDAENAAMFAAIDANYTDSVRLLSQGRTARFHGDATLFVATKSLPAHWQPRSLWNARIDKLHIYEVDCAHENILAPEALVGLGPLLAKLLADVPSLR